MGKSIEGEVNVEMSMKVGREKWGEKLNKEYQNSTLYVIIKPKYMYLYLYIYIQTQTHTITWREM